MWAQVGDSCACELPPSCKHIPDTRESFCACWWGRTKHWPPSPTRTAWLPVTEQSTDLEVLIRPDFDDFLEQAHSALVTWCFLAPWFFLLLFFSSVFYLFISVFFLLSPWAADYSHLSDLPSACSITSPIFMALLWTFPWLFLRSQ